ncbi:MAG: DUF748 domain-containing protein [Candidatus Omnitrophica bacterium]|nr:DUF748 domain-containing protein [Candidatus Omnitrophota bacterium]
MIKKVLIITAVIVVLAIAAVFIYRYQLISYSAENLIRNALPGYVKISKIKFDFNNKKAFLEGFKLEGPRGFSDSYTVEIAEVSCRYKLKGATILDGLEVFEPILKDMIMHIERLPDGRVNLSEMGGVIGPGPSSADGSAQSVNSKPPDKSSPEPRAANFIKLPNEFNIKNGKIIFTDRFFVRGSHVITLDNIDAGVNLKVNDAYSQVLDIASTGEGNIDSHKDQIVRWAISFNPNTPRLTMSSRFDVSSVDLITFEPYYDKFSPFEFAKCRVSGILVFNSDNGNIGSTNELHLANLMFSVKPNYENVAMFEINIQDLTKYFTSFTGEVIFDFKIKGDMANPRFFLGPISKQAVAAMVMDKVGDVLQQMSRKGSGAAGSAAADSGNSDVDKAMRAISMVKGFLDKKN